MWEIQILHHQENCDLHVLTLENQLKHTYLDINNVNVYENIVPHL
jgi:hypothetical protein